jgi:hypothetical protein
MKQYLFLCSTLSSVVFLPLTVTQFKTWLSLRTSLTQGAVCRYIWIEECSSKRIQSALMLFPFLCQLLVITALSLYTPLYEKLFTYKTHLLGMSNISVSPLPHIPTFSVSSFEQLNSLSLKHTFLPDESESLTSILYMWVSCAYFHFSVGACFHEAHGVNVLPLEANPTTYFNFQCILIKNCEAQNCEVECRY